MRFLGVLATFGASLCAGVACFELTLNALASSYLGLSVLCAIVALTVAMRENQY